MALEGPRAPASTAALHAREPAPTSCRRTAALVAVLVWLGGCSGDPEVRATGERSDTIFAAVEGDGTVAQLDGVTGSVIRTVDLSEATGGSTMMFDVHNVQAAPDGRTVWLTAMPMLADDRSMPEQLIGVDTSTGRVTQRIELGNDLHVAHVVLRGSLAYVSAYDADLVLAVDLESRRVIRSFVLPSGTHPHGMRLTPDGVTLVVAGMGKGSLHTIHTGTGYVTSYALPGRAVQTAVLPDGSAAFASVYDTRQVAKLDLKTGSVTLFELPPGAAGPVQLYPGPGASLWIADQGMLDGDAPGDRLYRMRCDDGAVDLSVEVSPGPHGVVVNADNGRVWTTTIVEGTVQSLDGDSGEILWTTAVGNGPNGITCLHGGGVMP